MHLQQSHELFTFPLQRRTASVARIIIARNGSSAALRSVRTSIPVGMLVQLAANQTNVLNIESRSVLEHQVV